MLGCWLQVFPQVSAALLLLEAVGCKLSETSWFAHRTKTQRPPMLVGWIRSRDLGLPQPGIVGMQGLLKWTSSLFPSKHHPFSSNGQQFDSGSTHHPALLDWP